MITAMSRKVCQPEPSQCSSAAAISTVAEVSQETPASSSTLRYREGSVRIAWSREEASSSAPGASACAPARDARTRATSALAHNPASSVATMAATTSHAMLASPGPFLPLPVAGGPALRAPRAEQLILQAEHGRTFIGFGVIISEQVQDAMGAQQLEFVPEGVRGAARLLAGHLGAQHHIAEQAGNRTGLCAGPRVRAAVARRRWPQLIHREGQDIRRARLTHPPLVQVRHGRQVNQQDGQLGEGVNAHYVQDVPGHRREISLIDADP